MSGSGDRVPFFSRKREEWTTGQIVVAVLFGITLLIAILALIFGIVALVQTRVVANAASAGITSLSARVASLFSATPTPASSNDDDIFDSADAASVDTAWYDDDEGHHRKESIKEIKAGPGIEVTTSHHGKVVTISTTNASDGDPDPRHIVDQVNVYRNVHTFEAVVVDPARKMNSGNYGVPGAGDMLRQIPVRVFMPATGPGTAANASYTLAVSFQHRAYSDGTFTPAGIPLLSSALKVYLQRSYTDNTPAAGPFNVVLTASDNSIHGRFLGAEELAATGVIVILVEPYGFNNVACPASGGNGGPVFAGCIGLTSARIPPRDLRAVVDAVVAGTLFSFALVKQPIRVGCIGNGSPAIWCARAHTGTATLIPNQDGSADYRFRAVMASQGWESNSPAYVPSRFNGSYALWGTSFYNGLGAASDPANLAALVNSARFVFYDVRQLGAVSANGMSIKGFCGVYPELIRVFAAALATPLDLVYAAGIIDANQVGTFLAHCSPRDLAGWQSIPLIRQYFDTFDRIISTETDHPLSGIRGEFIHAVWTFYSALFLRGALDQDNAARMFSEANTIAPALIDHIYVNQYPATPAVPFDLQSKTVQIDLSINQKQFTARSYASAPTIAVPGGSTTLFAAGWDDDEAFVNTSFPVLLHKATSVVASTKTLVVSANGYIWLGTHTATTMFQFQGRRQARVVEDSANQMAFLFAGDAVDAGATPVYILNTASQLTITWINATSFDSGFIDLFSMQLSIYVNGTTIFRYDGRIPADVGTFGVLSYTVGLTSGRLRVSNRNYNYQQTPKITTMTQVLAGNTARNSDAVIQVYSAGLAGFDFSGGSRVSLSAAVVAATTTAAHGGKPSWICEDGFCLNPGVN